MARARRPSLPARARALARARPRSRRVRSPSELPSPDADPHAIAGEVVMRDLAQQPLWISSGCRTFGIETGDLVVRTRIGHFVTRMGDRGHQAGGVGDVASPWPLEAAREIAAAASRVGARDHPARRERPLQAGAGTQPFESADPDTSRIWWSEIGVHRVKTFPVQPDPVSGMHCWHQRVTLEKLAKRTITGCNGGHGPRSASIRNGC